MVITGSLNALFDRPEDFVIWGQSDYPQTQWYNGSLWMLRTGTRSKVWTQFDSKTSPTLAWKAGKKGSDQGWLGYVLHLEHGRRRVFIPRASVEDRLEAATEREGRGVPRQGRSLVV
jgi:hypothetical protein